MNQRSFHWLWIGQSAANLGDAFYTLAVVSHLYELTHSATFAAMVPLLRVGSMLVGGLIAPLIMARFSLKGILSASQWGQTGLLVALYAAISVSVSHVTEMISIFAVILMMAFLDGWTVPTRNALVPRLIPEAQWVKANGWLLTSDQIVQMIGWIAGGMLSAKWGVWGLIGLTFGMFLFSSISLQWVNESGQPREKAENRLPKREQWLIGWKTLWSRPILRRLVMTDILDTAAGSVWVGALTLVFVKDILHRGSEWWGWINGSYFAGMILGGMIVVHLSRYLDRNLVWAMGWGSLLAGVFILIYARNEHPGVALALCLLMGPPYQLRETAQRTLLQKSVDDTLLPHVLAAHGSLTYATFGLSVLAMSLAADLWGIQTPYIISGLLLMGAAIIALTATNSD
ncbi:MFS transporter [Polycladomyces subterraneus]|uniref:MFS transporter n=1 Tax=Polycladomyces subterraneus TaxID=1016997 RepID=A0ABT8IKH1_9BACL|nr:MFS transporter [Polycladomyces subterraneus]MDN4593215.1 MFS transporter [Polycladomyces subterraneus]